MKEHGERRYEAKLKQGPKCSPLLPQNSTFDAHGLGDEPQGTSRTAIMKLQLASSGSLILTASFEQVCTYSSAASGLTLSPTCYRVGRSAENPRA
jgi:hypothetical protein